MNRNAKHIAYRCPECGVASIGLFDGITKAGDLLRLRCTCSESALDIIRNPDEKLRLGVPCIFCKTSHSYVISPDIAKREGATSLGCPFSGMDIVFIGTEEELVPELERTDKELRRLMAELEAEELSDIQPQDMPDAEILPDPAVYDILRFVVKDLEADGKVHCLCDEGRYDLRFTDTGLQMWCESCGATFDFNATSPSIAEEYLSLDEIFLK